MHDGWDSLYPRGENFSVMAWNDALWVCSGQIRIEEVVGMHDMGIVHNVMYHIVEKILPGTQWLFLLSASEWNYLHSPYGEDGGETPNTVSF